MAAKTSYYSMNGMLLGESTSGVMRNYVSDALGSVVGTASNGLVENTYQYKPYGAILASTGSATSPSFLWNGGSGYRGASLAYADMYIRARHYSSVTTLWTTVDPLWPEERSFTYVAGSPTSRVDPSGLACWTPTCCSAAKSVAAAVLKNISTKNKGVSQVQWTIGVKVMQKKPVGAAASYKYEEMTNVPYPIAGYSWTPGWNDLTKYAALVIFVNPTFGDYQCSLAKQSNCVKGGTKTGSYVSQVDPPTYNYGATKPVVRCLCMRLTVYDGCGGATISKTISQTVSFQVNPPIVHAPSDYYTDLYCSGKVGTCAQFARSN